MVIGSGPCGLGAAYRLQELGHEDFLVLEAGPEAGGLSITATDENGFLFDMGASCVRGVFVWVCGWAGGRSFCRWLRSRGDGGSSQTGRHLTRESHR